MRYHPKLLEQVVDKVAVTTIGVLGISLIVLWVYQQYVPNRILLLWIFFQSLFLVSRVFNALTIRKHLADGTVKQLQYQTYVLLVLMVCSALLWNALLIGGAMVAPPSYKFFSLIVTLGLITASIISISPAVHVFYAFFFLLLIPQLVFFVQNGGKEHYAVLLSSCIYVPYVLILQRIINKNTMATIKTSERLLDSVDELHKTSIMDPLTNVHNRRYFFSISKNMIDLSIRENKEVSLLVLDIDYFKKINDTYGHQAGDAILQDLAAAINKTVRKSDVFARIGGEEFSLLLYGAANKNAVMVGRKICQTIEKKEFNYADMTISVTVSIGVSTINEEDNSLEALFARADQNLYKAKEAGRNRCVA